MQTVPGRSRPGPHQRSCRTTAVGFDDARHRRRTVRFAIGTTSLGRVNLDPGAARRLRDRRERGRGGPWILPGPHSPQGVPADRSRRDRFDALVLSAVAELEAWWPAELAEVEFGVEEVPWVEDDWQPAEVPVATLVHRSSRRPARIVVYRLPIRTRAHRAARPAIERDLVYAALIHQVAELLGRPPHEIDQRPAPAARAVAQPSG
jgi:zinicin-like metallopeptidase